MNRGSAKIMLKNSGVQQPVQMYKGIETFIAKINVDQAINLNYERGLYGDVNKDNGKQIYDEIVTSLIDDVDNQGMDEERL